VIVTLKRNNITMIRTVRKNKLMDNFHPMKNIGTSSKISFRLCKLLFLQHHCNINKHDFFDPMRDQNIQEKKYDDGLCLKIVGIVSHNFPPIQ